ncbi:unnamed protein product [marine sediment metagenome]|uniref:Uncharacterized protein n=1 Tax=marine sediment metagenome TaxID=412755 RepID=X1SGF3_9ZZZZ
MLIGNRGNEASQACKGNRIKEASQGAAGSPPQPPELGKIKHEATP